MRPCQSNTYTHTLNKNALLQWTAPSAGQQSAAQARSAPPLRSERTPHIHQALQGCGQGARWLGGLRSQQAGCPGICQHRYVRIARLRQVPHALSLGPKSATVNGHAERPCCTCALTPWLSAAICLSFLGFNLVVYRFIYDITRRG